MFGYTWTERLSLINAAPLADQPNWFEKIVCHLGIPEIMMLLGAAIIVNFMLEALGQKPIGKMVLVVGVFQSIAVLVTNLSALCRGV